MKASEFIDTDLLTEPSKADVRSESKKGSPMDRNGLSGNPSQGRAEIDARVEQARQQMLELRRQQEELERERQELEDLRRREEDFEKGKAEMLDELSRGIIAIEKEEFELNKRAAMLTGCREVYQDYVHQLQDIRETEWSGDDLKPRLAKAVSVLEAARAELNKGRAQLSFLGDGPIKMQADSQSVSMAESIPMSRSEGVNFKEELLRGLARHLPLILSGLVALVFVLSRSHS